MIKSEVVQILQEIKDCCKGNPNCIGCKYSYSNDKADKAYCAFGFFPELWKTEKINREDKHKRKESE